jgi:hypothetical protein
VYKLRKALYGLKQAPRAWYCRLKGFLFERGFEMGKVDQTLLLFRQGRDILIVQVYVDDIVFGGSSNSLVAQSTTEAEFVAVASCCSQLLWITYTTVTLARSIPMSHFNVAAPMP